ncbi:PEGA domain-containing protein [Coraliomargarita akajimensis]|uniref:PEGA domain protein n=1 Tax=Coraliomargarita akajimensis (strain DSM 45221 / IAM 15411 / JCM 23193 / KCTC 12865 / 04OKA010-24) TaxID=583355 RepID=D5EJF6_CORAD|nr:PEGA domain-containing protein [Coraliomargarita akajimensis]ADE54555.1 PEGA domain protein [Coraliomargarita akajimensis DSM 45221]
MKPRIISSLLLAAFVALVGCKHLDQGLPQEVTIVSSPSEASVYINGEAVGITPMSLDLPRKVVHEVRLEKKGYNPSVRYFTPVPNDKSKNFIRFGLSRDLGHYVDLEPGEMDEEMKSELVPNSVGADPFARMAEKALEADRQLEAGEISPKEHKQIIEQILKFFEENN